MSTQNTNARSKRLTQDADLAQRNLITALRQGLINWFQFFELWKDL